MKFKKEKERYDQLKVKASDSFRTEFNVSSPPVLINKDISPTRSLKESRLQGIRKNLTKLNTSEDFGINLNVTNKDLMGSKNETGLITALSLIVDSK